MPKPPINPERADVGGFTLVELMVVISIIAMLAAVILVSLQGARSKAMDAKSFAELHQLDHAIQEYYWDTGHYPYQDNPTGMVPLYGNNYDNDPSFLSALVPRYLDQEIKGSGNVWYVNNDGNVGGSTTNATIQNELVNNDCPNTPSPKAALVFVPKASGTYAYYGTTTFNVPVNVICYK